ncbi:hypothetical protein C0L86_12580 [Streptomyces sp. SCA2-2]|uniref:Uncharacterized protein n=1 Tax=Streptomyces koyangensis TaxID=188770 RepID=A0A385DAV0_9ACTN|nr:hypothetical protein D0C37_13520 [Streptomyces koyangensis]PKR44655.1 hypothetical protein CWE27_13610 [Streptomyces sp. EAG2]RZE99638.1 hypothetical protein C0L86_12580 [Streptomyces sp. SCA2-2]
MGVAGAHLLLAQVQAADLTAGLGEAPLQLPFPPPQGEVGSAGTQHCERRSDQNNKQDPQQWLLDE